MRYKYIGKGEVCSCPPTVAIYKIASWNDDEWDINEMSTWIETTCTYCGIVGSFVATDVEWYYEYFEEVLSSQILVIPEAYG